MKAYEDYIWKWHGFLKDCENAIFGLDDKNRNILTLYVLRSFFEAPYRADDENGFYEEFSVKMEEVRKKLDGLKEFFVKRFKIEKMFSCSFDCKEV